MTSPVTSVKGPSPRVRGSRGVGRLRDDERGSIPASPGCVYNLLTLRNLLFLSGTGSTFGPTCWFVLLRFGSVTDRAG